MITEFKKLDKLINLNEPEIIAFSGLYLVDMLTGDIANNICLHQDCEVLEMVSHNKEYLIKRLVINQANVNYRNWYRKAYKIGWNRGCDEIENWFTDNMKGASLEEVPIYVKEAYEEGLSETYPVLVIDPDVIQWNGKIDPIE